MDRASQIAEMLSPTIAAMGCELWGIELIDRGKNSTLRVFIDKDGGVDLGDCERVSRQVSGLMDVEDPIAGAYTLEVSSPGVDRQLFCKEQYAAWVGSLLKVRLRTDIHGRRNYMGRLVGLDTDHIVVQQDAEEVVLPLELLGRVQVVPEFE